MAYETPTSSGGGMTGEDSMSAESMPDHDMSHHDDGKESMSIFAPKAFAMGTKFKAGDIMEVKVADIDPETGDFELQYNTGNGESEEREYGSEGPSMKGFDAAMDAAPEKE